MRPGSLAPRERWQYSGYVWTCLTYVGAVSASSECGSGETGDHVSGHVTATRMPHLNGTEGIFVETAGLLELEGCGSEKRAECDLPRRVAVILHKRRPDR